MKRDSWRPSDTVERQYLSDLLNLLRRFFGKGEEARVIGEPEWLEAYAWQAAKRMINGLLHGSARTWREAARESMKGRVIYAALHKELEGPTGSRVRQLIHENATLIRTLPLEVARKTNAMIAEHAFAGERFESFEKLIGHESRVHARLIARTETSKASTALTQARSEDLGLKWFVWQTSEDQRVRLSHRKMQGVLASWNDLPSPERLIGQKNAPAPYAPGNIYNCRCYPEVLVDLDQISWPHRCYRNGAIQYITRAAFKRLNETRLPLAA